MSPVSCPIPVRRWFKSDPAALEQQLNDLLTNPGQSPPSEVSHWLTQFAYHTLTPPPTVGSETAIVQQRVWVSFALRYLHPLLTDADHLAHHDAVTHVIKQHFDLIQQLIESEDETIIQLLQQPLPDKFNSSNNGQYPQYLHTLADREMRTFARSAERGREQLITALQSYLSKIDYNPVAEVLRTYLSRKETVAVHRALRAHHHTYQRLLAQHSHDPQHQRDIALSLSEFNRRLKMIDEFRVWDMWVLLGIEMGMFLLVLWMDVTTQSKISLILILGVLIACLFYTRITYAITDAMTWADKELRLLTMHDDPEDI